MTRNWTETLALMFLRKFPKNNINKINKKVTFRLQENKFGGGGGGEGRGGVEFKP